jgi:hypothetical protein
MEPLAARIGRLHHGCVDEEPLIHRDELTSFLFTVSDIRKDVHEIRRLLREEEDDGEEGPEADG